MPCLRCRPRPSRSKVISIGSSKLQLIRGCLSLSTIVAASVRVSIAYLTPSIPLSSTLLQGTLGKHVSSSSKPSSCLLAMYPPSSSQSSVASVSMSTTFQPSPILPRTIRGKRVLVKHDERLVLPRSGISGNKARKMYTLNEIPAEHFPRLVVSHGGPQSNAMAAIAAVVATKPGSRFRYFTKTVPRWLKEKPTGNYKRARLLNTEIIELEARQYEQVFGGDGGPTRPPASVLRTLGDSSRTSGGGPRSSATAAAAAVDVNADSGDEESSWDDLTQLMWIPQGGACASAEEGVRMLANEIVESRKEYGIPSGSFVVVLPSGTGSTAMFLAKYLHPHGIRVVTVPCVGDGAYLQRQMETLRSQSISPPLSSSSSASSSSPPPPPPPPLPLPPLACASLFDEYLIQLDEKETDTRSGRYGRDSTDVSNDGGNSSDVSSSDSDSGSTETSIEDDEDLLPVVLEGATKEAFGEPRQRLLDVWLELQAAELDVDLLYAARTWEVIFENWDAPGSPVYSSDQAERQLLYVHTGGLEGFGTQMNRYKRSNMWPVSA